MLKSKMMFGLIAVVMVLALAQSGYAQLNINATGNPSLRETATNRTAETNDPTVGNGLIITGEYLSDAFVTGARLRITFPAEITNSLTFPAADPIAFVSPPTGIFAGATIAAVDNDDGRVDINLPCALGVTNATGTMILAGVRVDASTITTVPANASLSSTTISTTGSRGPGCAAGIAITAVNVIIGTPTVAVINTVPAGIGSVANGGMPASVATADITIGASGGADTGCTGINTQHLDCGVATIYTSRSVPDGNASFTVSEGHRTAWFNSDQFLGATGFLNDGGFRLTFNGLPSGVTLTLGIGAYTTGDPQLSRTSITTANNTSNVTFAAALSTGSDNDRVTFRITGITVGSSTTLTNASITVTATMFPLGDALDENDAILTASFPRYLANEVGPASIVSIVAANTTHLIPFAVAAGAYDTGIAIANTSLDPFGATTGGAVAQSGTVRVDLFPSTATGAGTSTNFTTSATKKAGGGMSADGVVAAGATWTVNLSELLPLAGHTGTFTGYMFIQSNFLFAHGAAYVYDGRGFTSSTPVMLLPSPAIISRNVLNF